MFSSLPVHETKGAIIQSKTQDAHVVCVQDAVAKPDTLPLGYQFSGSHHHL